MPARRSPRSCPREAPPWCAAEWPAKTRTFVVGALMDSSCTNLPNSREVPRRLSLSRLHRKLEAAPQASSGPALVSSVPARCRVPSGRTPGPSGRVNFTALESRLARTRSCASSDGHADELILFQNQFYPLLRSPVAYHAHRLLDKKGLHP
ncbi:MAG: hypothetical protein MZV64_09195 [Ignavibacteriales bacterium]|nr:hypothetical protein [Ignavibacteriales bacterium]